MKKRVDVTLDSNVCEVIEKMRLDSSFKPSRSEVINSLLKSHPKLKKRLEKDGR